MYSPTLLIGRPVDAATPLITFECALCRRNFPAIEMRFTRRLKLRENSTLLRRQLRIESLTFYHEVYVNAFAEEHVD